MTKRLRIASLIGALALAAIPASAAKMKPVKADAAYAAFQTGYYITAHTEAEARLKKQPKDAAAMTLLGEIYSQGLGVPPQPEVAAQWYDKAAHLGDAHAMATYGLMLIDGLGVNKDTALGKTMLEQAAGKGSALAAYNLGLLLLNSSNAIEITHAAILIREAAEAEIPEAQYALGVLYRRGRGVDKDAAEAVKWLQRATENGSVNGEVEYAILVFNGEGVPANEELGAKHFRRAAYQGNAIAQNRLARIYAIGRGLPKDRVEAAAWHMSAASKGLADAWLDADLRDISLNERIRAERLVHERASMQ